MTSIASLTNVRHLLAEIPLLKADTASLNDTNLMALLMYYLDPISREDRDFAKTVRKQAIAQSVSYNSNAGTHMPTQPTRLMSSMSFFRRCLSSRRQMAAGAVADSVVIRPFME
jgi:hypothetical protein